MLRRCCPDEVGVERSKQKEQNVSGLREEKNQLFNKLEKNWSRGEGSRAHFQFMQKEYSLKRRAGSKKEREGPCCGVGGCVAPGMKQ